MDALVRARDESIAALASANASKHSAGLGGGTSQRRTAGSPNDAQTHPERAPNVDFKQVRTGHDDPDAPHIADAIIAADSLTPVTAELDSLREQLASLLAAAPSLEPGRAPAEQHKGEPDTSVHTKSRETRPNHLSMWVLVSILLNVAALGAAAAIGARQLWDHGASEPVQLSYSIGLTAACSSLCLLVSALRTVHLPCVPMQRLQATELPRATTRRDRQPRASNLLLLSLVVVLCKTAPSAPAFFAPIASTCSPDNSGKRLT
eukprot:6189816-Pleurochrysis_carterae.AAC.1